MKVYIYKMHAGIFGTDEVYLHVDTFPLDNEMRYSIMYDHTTSYQDQDENGEWTESEPEIWLEATVTTVAELENELGYILRGGDRFENLVTELESEGMVFQDE